MLYLKLRHLFHFDMTFKVQVYYYVNNRHAMEMSNNFKNTVEPLLNGPWHLSTADTYDITDTFKCLECFSIFYFNTLDTNLVPVCSHAISNTPNIINGQFSHTRQKKKKQPRV